MKLRMSALSILVLCLSFLFLSCKKENDLYWVSWGEGNISYNLTADETSLRIAFAIVSWNSLDARISGWRIVFKAKKAQLLEVNDGNHQAYAPFVAFGAVRHNDTSSFVMQSVNPADAADRRPYRGRLFPGDPPDNVDVFVTITDDSGKAETIEQNLLVTYSTAQ